MGLQARSHVESVNLPKSFVSYPPESKNSDQDRVKEDVHDHLQEESLIFEPAGCHKINHFEISSNNHKFQIQDISSKCEKASISKRKKLSFLIVPYYHNSRLKILQASIRIHYCLLRFDYGKCCSRMSLSKK